MSFVYPQFLFGLLALGIPIIIHLFNFRKARKIYFSSNQFLLNIKKATSTKLKLKHYLILLSRLLFILFLVISFAQPFIPAKEKNIQSNQAIIYLDNSFSMSNYVDEDMTALEVAISFIQKIIDVYPQNSQFLLLTNDFAPFSNTPKSKKEIEELLTEINYTGISRSSDEVFRRIDGYDFDHNVRDIYWLSDFQISTSGDLSSFINDTIYNIFLIPQIFSNTLNVYVDSLYLSNPFLIQNEKNELNVILHSDGEGYIEDLLIKLFINDIQSANGSISINPNSTAQITFDLNTQLDKYNYGRISFEDFPVTFDNDFYFTLVLSDRISIIELKDTDSTTVIQKVFGNQQLFNFQSYNSNNINYNDVLKADLVVLNELDDLEPTIRNVLLDYLTKKGDLFVVPSPDINLSSFMSLLGKTIVIPDSLQTTQPLDHIDLNNPFFSEIFEDNENQFDMPSAKAVINITGANNTIMKFRSERNFLSYLQSENRVYVLACPLRPDYTDFQSHAIFVPIMYRVAMLSKKTFNRMYYSLDESIIKITADSINNESIVKLRNQDKEIVPETRIVGNELILDIPKFELTPSHYNIEVENLHKGILAFNPSKSESRLEQYTFENLNEVCSENSYVKLFNTKGFDIFDKEIKEKYLGIPLWRISLILALIFLLVEILLIRFL